MVTIDKDWDGNERVREGKNCRVYVSRGRWVWTVLVDGEHDRTFDSAREARERKVAIEKNGWGV